MIGHLSPIPCWFSFLNLWLIFKPEYLHFHPRSCVCSENFACRASNENEIRKIWLMVYKHTESAINTRFAVLYNKRSLKRSDFYQFWAWWWRRVIVCLNKISCYTLLRTELRRDKKCLKILNQFWCFPVFMRMWKW